MATKVNLTDSLKQLEEIAAWFDEQDEIDVEAGLDKVKQAAKLIKDSKARLAEIENEFKAVEKDIADDTEDSESIEIESVQAVTEPSGNIDLDSIPF